MKNKNAFMLAIAAAVAFGGALVAGCAAEEETAAPAPDPNRTVNTPPAGAELGSANPAKAPTGPDGGPP